MAAPLVLLTLFLLDLCWCCSSSVHVTSVFQWDVMDFNWPSEEKRTKAVLDKSFKPESISPRYAAVFGNRLFLSLSKENGGNPVSLAWLPTRSTSASEPPKLNPFPYWRMHEGPNRSDTIMRATGLEVDRLGRLLWVLDVSYQNSKSKLWIFNLKENDAIHLVHQFGDIFGLNDLVLDETPDDWLAYITYYLSDNLIAFSLKTNQSWLVETQGQRFVAIAISPKNEQIYLSNHGSKELYSIGSVGLRNGSRAANPELIGNWTAQPCRLVVDKHGGLLASFFYANFTAIWNTTQPFQEQSLYEVKAANTYWPITLALDTSGTLWMTVQSKIMDKPRYRLLKAAVGAKFNVPKEPKIKKNRKNPTACVHLEERNCSFTNGSDQFRENHKNRSSINVLPIILICLAVIIIVSIAILIAYFLARAKKQRNSADLPRFHELQQMIEIPLNAARPPSPGLYETPKSRSSDDNKIREFKPCPTVAEIMDRLGPPPPIPTSEYDDVGPLEPQPENLYVLAGPSRSSNYLRILPSVDRPQDLSY